MPLTDSVRKLPSISSINQLFFFPGFTITHTPKLIPQSLLTAQLETCQGLFKSVRLNRASTLEHNSSPKHVAAYFCVSLNRASIPAHNSPIKHYSVYLRVLTTFNRGSVFALNSQKNMINIPHSVPGANLLRIMTILPRDRPRFF